MRRALGLAVFSGMLGVTFFGIFLTPVFFYVIRRIRSVTPAPEKHAPRGLNTVVILRILILKGPDVRAGTMDPVESIEEHGQFGEEDKGPGVNLESAQLAIAPGVG